MKCCIVVKICFIDRRMFIKVNIYKDRGGNKFYIYKIKLKRRINFGVIL